MSEIDSLIRILNVTTNEVQYEGGETYAQEENCNGNNGGYVVRRFMQRKRYH